MTFLAAISNGLIRRECFDISITNDLLPEDSESFTVILELDNTFVLQTGITVQPNTTEIFIVDSDVGGKAHAQLIVVT